MILKEISLQNFRSYQEKEFKFSRGLNLVVGPNTAGKTNLLEAIFLLASRKSFRAKLETEMINYQSQIARLKGRVEFDSQKITLEIVLTKGELNGVKVAKKRYLVNGVSRRLVDFLENFRVVYFGPQDLEIIINSPSIRREWLDMVLEQADRDYRRASLSYKKGLRQRNRLLEQIRDEGRAKSSLFFWDKLLLENGNLITQKRQEFIDFINQQPKRFGELTVYYDKSVISPQRLAKYAQQEIAAGLTLIGPHRDDFRVLINPNRSNPNEAEEGRDLSIYGSRGEQRTAVFNLKLAELEFMTQKIGARPVLLLDDIFSELDHQRREHLLTVIPKQQTIITTSDIHLVEKKYLQEMEVIKLNYR
jgi:DNA replication and repair protein RecF